MRIIGVSGKARSGKDEFAKMLCEAFGFKQMSFADKVKKFGIAYFGLTHQEAYVKKTPFSRRVLQGVGNSIRQFGLSELNDDLYKQIAVQEFGVNEKSVNRKTKNNLLILSGIKQMLEENRQLIIDTCGVDSSNLFWVDFLFNSLDDSSVYVISDVRYKNEASRIVANHGRNIRIDRIDKPEIEAGAQHISEIDLDDFTGWDYTIMNEHKKNWKELLLLDSINMVRKFQSQGFFTQNDTKKFKLNID